MVHRFASGVSSMQFTQSARNKHLIRKTLDRSDAITLVPFVTVNAVLFKWKYWEENLNEILLPKAIRECLVRFLSDFDTDIDLFTSRRFAWNMQQINWNVKPLNGQLLLLIQRFYAREIISAICLCIAAACCRCLFVEIINLNFLHSK